MGLIAEIDGSDYINASWITDKREIATQGPLPNTVVHFLQMICEQKIDIIVMLTKTVEESRRASCKFNFESKYLIDIVIIQKKTHSLTVSAMGNIKCEKYWPDVSESLTFDHMEIKTLDETEMIENEIIQRTLKIESKQEIC